MDIEKGYGRTNRRADGPMDERMDRQKDKQTYETMESDT